MNMKKNSDRSAPKGRKLIHALFAGWLAITSVAGWAQTSTEIPIEFLDPAELAQAPEWSGAALSVDELELNQSPLSVAGDDWSSDRPPGKFARPLNKLASVCGDCEVHLGVGGTYHSFEGTGGLVIPLTVSWDRSRWEIGVFHFSKQTSDDNALNTERLVARPYWGTSISRRFHLFERGPLRAIFGFGVSYRTETDILSATRFNFSSQFGLRFQSPSFPAVFELSARHWSNGGIKTPNRGQDFTILTVRFDR
jgi:hypothetical protein